MPNRQETNQSECAIGRRLARGILPLVVGAAICSALAGCYKPLFPPEAPRTQFETYDRMRSRYVPLEEPDVFGTPQPALRARLGRKE
jgi:hypothetical protein